MSMATLGGKSGKALQAHFVMQPTFPQMALFQYFSLPLFMSLSLAEKVTDIETSSLTLQVSVCIFPPQPKYQVLLYKMVLKNKYIKNFLLLIFFFPFLLISLLLLFWLYYSVSLFSHSIWVPAIE